MNGKGQFEEYEVAEVNALRTERDALAKTVERQIDEKSALAARVKELAAALKREHRNCVTCARAALGDTYPCATGAILEKA